MVREKTSRPNWSVPNHQRSDGGRSRLTGAILNGSLVAISGARIAMTIRAASSRPPKAMVGLRRMAVTSEKRRGGARSSTRMAMSVADSRVEEGVGDVDDQVDHHLGRGED